MEHETMWCFLLFDCINLVGLATLAYLLMVAIGKLEQLERPGCKCGGNVEAPLETVTSALKTAAENAEQHDPLEKIPTSRLVEELWCRDGVETAAIEPYQEATIPVSGPAMVLIVND